MPRYARLQLLRRGLLLCSLAIILIFTHGYIVQVTAPDNQPTHLLNLHILGVADVLLDAHPAKLGEMGFVELQISYPAAASDIALLRFAGAAALQRTPAEPQPAWIAPATTKGG